MGAMNVFKEVTWVTVDQKGKYPPHNVRSKQQGHASLRKQLLSPVLQRRGLGTSCMWADKKTSL